MKKLLQQIDPDYYRSVQLLIAHAELKQLREWRAGVKRRSKIPLGMYRSLDNPQRVPAQTAVEQAISAESHTGG
jgi:hypothetical protein